MSTGDDFSALRAELEGVPRDRPVVLLLRHADRPQLPEGEVGDHIGLTPEGERRARALGAVLGGRICAVRSSPIGRCLQTAERILEGAGLDLPVEPDRLLGDPGCFIEDAALAWQSFLRLGNEGVYLAQLCEEAPLPGFRRTAAGVALLMAALPGEGAPPGVHVWVTHDSVLGIVKGHMEERRDLARWPAFLDGDWWWRGAGEVHHFRRHAVPVMRALDPERRPRTQE